MKWIVYQTINVLNNKIYVGVHKTENPDLFDGYIGCSVIITHPSSYANPETPFQYAVKKYGPSKFKRTILKVFNDPESAFNMEAEIVNRDFIKRKDTYNIHLGGLGGRIGRPINQFDFDGKLIKTWELIQDAADFYYCDWMSIYYSYEYKVSRKGFYWSYDSKINISEWVNAKATPVYKYDSESLKCIDFYPSQHAAAKENNVKLDRIQRSVRGRYKTDGFYYSDKLFEEYSPIKRLDISGKPIYVYSLDGTFIKELITKDEITSFFGIKNGDPIRNALRTGRQYKDYQVSLEKFDKLEPIKDKRKEAKRVGRFSLSGDLLEEYDTVTLAREAHGTGVSRCLRGQQKQCHNFIFKYI